MSDFKQNKSSIAQFIEAFLEYLRRPKTVFDLKDRAKALFLFILVIIILQQVVKRFTN